MKEQNIVMVCQQNWDLDIGSNAKNLAKEFAKDNQVLYVNMPLDVNTVLRGYRQPEVKKKLRVLYGQAKGIEHVATNLWVYTPDILCLSINWLPGQALFGSLNQFNSRLFARSIRKATRTLGFHTYLLLQDGLLFQGVGLKELLEPRKFIYYLRDYMVTMPYFRRHGTWAEERLLQQADVVATNSAYLADYALRHNPHSYDIGQGCVLSLYQADAVYDVPADLAAVPKPRIGYTGFLTGLRLDIDLLVAIARQRPAWSLVLVGPQDSEFEASELHALPNVHFLGGKLPEQLPAYVNHFDVCINPQAFNEITVGNYPLKIDEYLAMGKPVVATRTRTMEMFQPHVCLARSEKEWLELLDKSIMEQERAQAKARINFARSHTWEASVAKLSHALEAAG